MAPKATSLQDNYSLQPYMVKDNVPLTKDFFKVQIPPMLTAVLADYF
jgi:hypothetical protein